MTDVRLTATNPEDSSVVPVACNAKGELKLEEPITPPDYDWDLGGDLTVSGSASVAGEVLARNINVNYRMQRTGAVFQGFAGAPGEDPALFTSQINSDGSAIFHGDLVVGSRSKKWMLVEQGGLCHMVEQTRAITAYLDDPYPKLRDVFAELNVIEKALEEVMEKLRMVEPDGWPVWDGSDNS